ncbi:MAG: ATP-binding protein [Silicimonas sp.]|nr:ATP-binding protein [Silicimonas sp.]
MFFRMLKGWMPRSLFGRSALIVLVPVSVTLMVVTVVFIQRLYEGVTEQMTLALSHEALLILDRVEAAADPAGALEQALEVAAPLDIEIAAGAPGVETRRGIFDLSGRTVVDVVFREIPGVLAVDLVSRDGWARIVIASSKGPVELIVPRGRLSARNPHQFLVLIGVTAILMSLVALIYLRNQVRPVRRLAFAAEAFGKGRVVPYRPSGAAEVRSAGTAFLDMRDRIERQIEQRTLMLSGVSHDLRTPLTRLQLGLSLIEDSEDVEAMRRDLKDMEAMLEAFLAFARGDALEAPERVDPIALARDLVEQMARNLPVLAGPMAGEGSAMLRPQALRRALENLINNGVRYGKEARLSVEVTSEAIVFVVEDSGAGIPEAQRDEVLRPFSRLDEARNQNRGSGVGLGLTIAADIARQHGGRLELGESRDLGGLRAELIIPR